MYRNIIEMISNDIEYGINRQCIEIILKLYQLPLIYKQNKDIKTVSKHHRHKSNYCFFKMHMYRKGLNMNRNVSSHLLLQQKKSNKIETKLIFI